MVDDRIMTTIAGLNCDLQRVQLRLQQQADDLAAMVRRLAALQVELAGGPPGGCCGGRPGEPDDRRIYRGVGPGDSGGGAAPPNWGLGAYSAEGELD